MRAVSKVSWRGWILAVSVLVTAASVAPIGPVSAADSGLVVDHVAGYRADPAAGRIDVAFEYSFHNTTDDIDFPGFFETVPLDAAGVTAVAGPGSIELELAQLSQDGDLARWVVVFPELLGPGEQVDVLLRWSIAAPPEPTDTFVLTPGSIAFDLYVGGTPDAASVTLVVEVPSGFSLLGDHRFEVAEGVSAVHTIDDVTPYEPIRMVFENVAALTRTIVDGEPIVTVAGWRSDGEWSPVITAAVEEMAPEATAWFGRRAEPLEIRQRPNDIDATAARDLEADDPFVTVGPEAGRAELAAELARAWLVDVDVDEEWFTEGLALAFARSVAAGTLEGESAAKVIAPIADQIGATGIRAVVETLRAATISYPGVAVEDQVLPPDWRTLLDLFEQVGGADADDLFREFVVPPEDHTLLDRRAAARLGHLALGQRSADWDLPPMLRIPMAEWDFTAFAARQDAVSDTLLARDELRAAAADVGLDLGLFAQIVFESATRDMVNVDTILAEQAEALDAVAEARRLVDGDLGLLARVGLIGTDPDAELGVVLAAWNAGEFEAATHDARALIDEIDGGVGRGTLRLVVPALILILLWNAIRRLRRRRVSRRAQADGLA